MNTDKKGKKGLLFFGFYPCESVFIRGQNIFPRMLRILRFENMLARDSELV